MILLSDIDELSDLGQLFGHFIHPTGVLKSFSYMKYPSNLYIGDDQNSWPYFYLIYDPTYIVYPFVNNEFLQPFMTTNPEEDLKQEKSKERDCVSTVCE
jgi:hypothetical protein